MGGDGGKSLFFFTGGGGGSKSLFLAAGRWPGEGEVDRKWVRMLVVPFRGQKKTRDLAGTF